MDRHNWDYEEIQYCIDRIFETFVLHEEYEYDKLLNELYIYFDTRIKKGSLKMFFSNIKYLLNKNKVPNTLMIAELKNASLTAKAAFNIAMKKYNEIFSENKKSISVEKKTEKKELIKNYKFNEQQENRCAGVGSTITYRIIEDDEINQVTLVEPAHKTSDNEVSKNSELGEALLYSKEGEDIKVNSIEPYMISILHISNPVYAIKLDKIPKINMDYNDIITMGLMLNQINKIKNKVEKNMTNVEFLNENFGTNFKGYQRCKWHYDNNIIVWMVKLDKSILAGWQNSIIDENTVYEIYVGALEDQIEGHKTVEAPYRLIVDKAQGYKVLGVYKYDVLNSKERTCRIWKKVANSITEFYNHQ